MRARIAAVVVTHNSAEAIRRCLPSLKGPDEIVVVDNASLDHSVEAVRHTAPQALVIQNETNKGFAAAVNQGVRACTADLILLLNPDAAVTTRIDAACSMAQRALLPEIGVVGGQLLGMDGNVQAGFTVRAFPTPSILSFETLGLNRLWPSNPLNRRYRMADFDHSQSQACEQPAGAFLMFRRSLFNELKGFDEGFYPVWFEDVDFCLRSEQAGYRNWYEPDCAAVHEGGHSVSALTLPKRHMYWYGSLLRFAQKHFDPLAAAFVQTTVAVGLALRGIASCWSKRRRPQSRAYFQAMRMTLRDSIISSPSKAEDVKRSPVA